jgi:circadian clock protein KaiC
VNPRRPRQEVLPTGSAGLDRILGGGIPARSANVVLGEPGTGKSLFVLQVLFHLAQQGKKALHFTTLSEPSLKLAHEMQQFSFFDETLLERSVLFADLGTVIRGSGADATLNEIFERVDREAPDVVVVDSFRAIRELLPDPAGARTYFYDLSVSLAARGVVSFFVCESGSREPEASSELAIADGVLRFAQRRVGRAAVREVEILKLRGTSHLGGAHPFEIGPDGLTFYPRLRGPETRPDAAVSLERIPTGVGGLDEMLGGGLFRGTTTLLSGGTGTGKTVTALAFLLEGARRGEPGLHVSLEETPAHLRAIAAGLGWDLPALEAQGLLALEHTAPVELDGDRFLHLVSERIERLTPRRVVLDGLTSLARASLCPPELAELASRFAHHVRHAGATAILTRQSEHLLASPTQVDLGASCAVDNLIQLAFVETDGALARSVAVLKARSTRHADELRQLVIVGQGGVEVGGPFSPPRGVLTGRRVEDAGRRRTRS